MSQAITEKPVFIHHAANAWTLDADSQQQVDAARRLIEMGVSAITTNQPTLLTKTLDGLVE